MVFTQFTHVPFPQIGNIVLFEPKDPFPTSPSRFEPLSSLPDDGSPTSSFHTLRSSHSIPRSSSPRRQDRQRRRPVAVRIARRTPTVCHVHASPPHTHTTYVPASDGLLRPDERKLFSLPSPASGHFLLAMQIHVQGESLDVLAMIDSGASGSFIGLDFARRANIQLTKKSTPIPITTIDGSSISSGPITSHLVSTISLGAHAESIQLEATSLGHYDVVLGLPWLRRHNPVIDWGAGTLTFSRCACSFTTSAPLGVGVKSPFHSHFPSPFPSPVVVHALEREYLLPTPTRQDNSISSILSRPPSKSFFPDHYSFTTNTPPPFSLSSATSTHCDVSSSTPASEHPDLTKIPDCYHAYADVFSKSKANVLAEHRPYDLSIDLMPDKTPPFGPLYSLNQPEQAELQTYIDEHLAKGFIRPSRSPASSPVLFVKKKGGKLRLCVDYRSLNAITIKNRYPIPRIADLLDRVEGCTVFTKIDLQHAFNLVRIREGDEWKTAFRTRYGLFEYLVMPFGLSNAPSAFQALINDVLRDLLDIHVVVYLDDILIFSKNQSDHEAVVLDVLQRLRDAKLFASLDKCEFNKSSVEFLGFILSSDGISMAPDKLSTIADWPTPSNPTDIQSFMGFVNFYRRFIPRLSVIAAPLTDLTKKDVGWTWSSDCNTAFEGLKSLFLAAPILRHFDPLRPIVLTTDASLFGIAGVLSQHDDEGHLHPVAYHSRKLIPAESRYQVHDRELLAIVECFSNWRHWLAGAAHQLRVVTDHKNLVYFMSSRPLNDRQSRWAMRLADFDFTLVHEPGKTNVADAPSRRIDYALGIEDLKTALHPPVLGHSNLNDPHEHRAVNALNTAESPPSDLLADIIAGYAHDPFIEDDARSPKPSLEKLEDYYYHQGRLYAPPPVRVRILQSCHDAPAAGHPGRAKTLDLVLRTFSWPGVRRFTRSFVTSCDLCQRTKSPRHAPYGFLQSLKVPTRPWADISHDMIVKLPLSDGYDSIWVVIDRLTKMAHFIPCYESMSSEDLADLYLLHVFRLHGLPSSITSDRGSTFASAFTRRLHELLGITTRLTTAYHPQANGQTERTNQTLETYLRSFISYQQDDWVTLLPLAEFAFNNATSDSTQKSPFFANYGYDPRFDLVSSSGASSVPAAEAYQDRLRSIHEELRLELEHANLDMARFYDQHAARPPSLANGDWVMLRRRNLKTRRPSDKLDFRSIGPFQVLSRVPGRDVYRLALPRSMSRIHPVFNINLLERAEHPSIVPGRAAPPPPALSIADESFSDSEIETVFDTRRIRTRTDYFVGYSNRSIAERRWIPFSDLPDYAHELARLFHTRFPTKPSAPALRRPAGPAVVLDHPSYPPKPPPAALPDAAQAVRPRALPAAPPVSSVPSHLLSYAPPLRQVTRSGRLATRPRYAQP